MRTSKQHVEEGIYHRHPASMSDILQTLTEEPFSLSFDKLARRRLKSALLFDFHLYIISDDAHGKTLYVPLSRRRQDRAGFYFETENSAPRMCTGMYKVVPATNSLLSKLPAWIHGGALLMRPNPSGGATPMLPKNGRIGISTPGAKRATMRFSSKSACCARPRKMKRFETF